MRDSEKHEEAGAGERIWLLAVAVIAGTIATVGFIKIGITWPFVICAIVAGFATWGLVTSSPRVRRVVMYVLGPWW
jgi:hypothetical protein